MAATKSDRKLCCGSSNPQTGDHGVRGGVRPRGLKPVPSTACTLMCCPFGQDGHGQSAHGHAHPPAHCARLGASTGRTTMPQATRPGALHTTLGQHSISHVPHVRERATNRAHARATDTWAERAPPRTAASVPLTTDPGSCQGSSSPRATTVHCQAEEPLAPLGDPPGVCDPSPRGRIPAPCCPRHSSLSPSAASCGQSRAPRSQHSAAGKASGPTVQGWLRRLREVRGLPNGHTGGGTPVEPVSQPWPAGQ